LKSKELLKLLLKNNFIKLRQSGSHAIFYKKGIGNIIVPIHNKDLPTGTLNSILKDAGLK